MVVARRVRKSNFLENHRMTSEDVFDVCDEHDNVIGQQRRSIVHAKNLLHRAVHIWVWNSAGEFLLQLRTGTKDQYPSCYTSSASGHVDAGEDYETAAHRELAEELQLTGELNPEIKLVASDETAFEHTMLYSLRTEQIPEPDPVEIAEIEFWQFDAVVKQLSKTPEKFTPPFQQLVQWWVKNHI